MSGYVILDTNLLLLYVVGLHSLGSIAKFKRTNGYTIADFRLLLRLLATARGLILTPNTVTETSNFLHSGADTPIVRGATLQLSELLRKFGERYVESASALKHSDVVKLGVADCVMLTLGQMGAVLLTADYHLWDAAKQARMDAVHFEQARESARYRSASRH